MVAARPACEHYLEGVRLKGREACGGDAWGLAGHVFVFGRFDLAALGGCHTLNVCHVCWRDLVLEGLCAFDSYCNLSPCAGICALAVGGLVRELGLGSCKPGVYEKFRVDPRRLFGGLIFRKPHRFPI